MGSFGLQLGGQDILLGKPPSFTQDAFIRATEKEEVFGGSKRGGKTVAGSQKAILMSVSFPGNKGYILRQDLTDLKESTLETFLRICPPELILDHNHTERRIMIKTAGVPSKVIYSGLSDSTDEESSKGKEAGWIWFDEPSEVKQSTYLMYLSQLCWELPPCKCPYMNKRNKQCPVHRRNGPCICVPGSYVGRCPHHPDQGFPPFQAWLTTNPEAGWVEDRFRSLIEQASDARKIVSNGKQVFIRSLPRDNPYLPLGWEEELRKGNTPEIWVKKYLDGVWGSVEGQVFKSYDNRIHDIQVPPPDFLKQLKLVGCLDHATTGITCFIIVGIDPDGNVFVLASHYQDNRRVNEHAVEIKKLADEWAIRCGKMESNYVGRNFGQHRAFDHFEYVLIDPSTQSKTQTTNNELLSIQDLYYREGIPTLAALNTMEAGVDMFQEYLHIKPTHIHPLTGERPSPSMFIVRENNRDGIKELIGWKLTIGENGVKKYVGKDHWLDCVRYILMSRPEPPRFTRKDLLSMDTHGRTAQHALSAFDKKFGQPPNPGQWFPGGTGGSNNWWPSRIN